MRHHTIYRLSFDFIDEDYDYIMFLKFDFAYPFTDQNIKGISDALEGIYSINKNSLVVLTNRKQPPVFSESEDEFVNSFSCSFYNFKDLLKRRNGFLFDKLLFGILDQVITRNSNIEQILIRQIPFQIDKRIFTTSTCDIIIPHRGDDKYLSNLFFFLSQIKKLKIYTGIDQDLTQEMREFRSKYPNSFFYNFVANPAGPYVVRNRLINKGNNELIFFQDSDDIPCADRFEKLTHYMNENECQFCGSHELRIDYFDKTVRAHRYPLDVMNALKIAPLHPILFPTTAITREAFYICETLSEERTFANDTKFLFFSYFKLNSIKNIDEFLYIRRRRPNSLTTSPDTKLGSPIRDWLDRMWKHEFESVKYERPLLDKSGLKRKGSRMNSQDLEF